MRHALRHESLEPSKTKVEAERGTGDSVTASEAVGRHARFKTVEKIFTRVIERLLSRSARCTRTWRLSTL